MAIIVKDLCYTYNEKTPFATKALKNVTVTIDEGEFVCVVGHTGSGKSTFIQHLNGLIRLQSGQLAVDGIDLCVKKPDFMALRGKIGMVFQYPEYQLFADTVFEDVAFGPRNMGLKDAEVKSRVFHAIERVGLNYGLYAEKSPFELSGGEKRRVAIAGVIAMEPRILVLDEPTAGLDPLGKNEILNLIEDIRKTVAPTVIMVNHDMNEVAEHATKVMVFCDGEMTEYLPPKDLFRKADYLTSIGLDLPTITKFASKLKESGVDIGDCLTVEQAYDRIIRLHLKDR